MSVVFANNAATTLAAAITSTSATTITVTSSSSFPSISGSEYFYATIDDGTNKEIVKVTGVSSETWTVVRAQDGTSARTFANGIDVELRNNAAMLSDIKSHFSLADDEILKIGTGNDLQLYHDGSNSYINGLGTGNVIIRNSTDDADILLQSDDGSGSVTTYITVDGSLATTVFNKNIKLGDSIEALFGSSSDFQIQHNGTDTHLSNTTGDLFITNNNDDKDVVLRCDDGSGGVATYMTFDGSATKVTLQKDLRADDDVKLQVGSSGDLFMVHESDTSKITNGTGNLEIIQNVDDGDIIFKSDDGSGGVATYLQLDGSEVVTSFLKTTRHLDSVKAMFGSSNDLQIYHDASNSYIDDTGTGDLRIRGDYVKLQGGNGENMLVGNQNGAVEVYHDNSKKLETTSTGVSVTGGLTTSGASTIDELTVTNDATLSGGAAFAGDATFGDNNKAKFGAGNDLEIYHDGSDSYIKDSGTGVLALLGSETRIQNSAGNENCAKFIPDGAVELYHDNSKKFETTSTGVSVTGGLTTSGASTIDELTVSNDATLSGGAAFAGDATFGDNNKAIFGTGSDLEIYHDGTDTRLANKTGIYYIQQHVDDGDVLIQSDNSSGGLTNYFKADGSNGQAQLFHYGTQKLNTNANGVAVSGAATGTLTTDNDGSFDMAASNNFKCTPSGNFTLTFTNIVSQSGNILLVNSGGHTVSAHTNSKVDANLLATVSTAGTYLISYFSDGTNVYLTNSAAYT